MLGNYYVIILISVIAVNLFFLKFLVSRLKDNPALYYYFIAVLMTIIWQGTDLAVWFFDTEDAWLYQLWRIGDLAALILVASLLFFVFHLADFNSKIIKAAIATITLGIGFLAFSGQYTVGFTAHPYFKFKDLAGPVHIINNIWLLVLFTFIIFLLFFSLLKTNDPKKKKQFITIFIGGMISVPIAAITEIILPRLGMVALPLGGIGTTIFIAATMVAIYRFNFMDIQPWRFSIAAKLLVMFILISFGTSAVIIVVVFQQGKRTIEDRIFAQLESVSTIKEQQIGNYLLQQVVDIENVSHLPVFSEHIMNFHSGTSSIDAFNHQLNVENVKNVLSEWKQYSDFLEVFFMNLDGQVYMSSDDEQIGKIKQNNNYFINGKKEVYVNNPYYSLTLGEPAMTVAAPVYTDNKELIGVVAGRIDLGRINEIMLERSGLGETGETYLVNRLNYFLTGSRSIPDSALKLRISDSALDKCLAGQNGQGQYLNYNDRSVLGIYKWLNVQEICLMAEIEEKEALLPLVQVAKNLATLSIFFVVGLFFLSLAVSKIFTRPIKKLVTVAQRISRGDLEAVATVKSRDEISDLSEIFNSMTANLRILQANEKDYSQTLEKNVDQKTRELKNILIKEKQDKANLEKQRIATLNILEDVSDSQDELKQTYEKLRQRSRQLSALNDLGDELASVWDIEETIMVVNKYLKRFLSFKVATYLVVNPTEEGGLVYVSYLNEAVSDAYFDKIEQKLIRYTGKSFSEKFKKNLKIIQSIRPKYIGEHLDNKNKAKPDAAEFFPFKIGNKEIGLMLISGNDQQKINAEERDLIAAVSATVALSIDRLQSLVITQHSKTASLVESLRDGVLMFNKNEEMILMNPAFSAYTGLSEPGFRMDSLYRLVKTKDLEQMARRALEKGNISFIKEVVLATRHFEVLVTPVRDISKQIVGGAILFHDITYLMEVDQMKTEFVSVASHQLRTPLTAIKLFTEMLLENYNDKMGKEHKEYLESIYQSTERMVLLVNDLLSLSRLESGRLKVDPRQMDINKFVKNIISEVLPVAKAKKVNIEFSPDETLPSVALDPNLMRQVVHNLLTNAIRYTEGSTKAFVAVSVGKPKNDFVIRIKDNGIGIPEEVKSRIFEKFYRADNAVKANTEGTGLGLYVSKMIVESSNGKIWFESEKGKGTTFYVTLPAKGMSRKEGEKTIDTYS